ncbi:MAG TPA: OpgC domain-containing protein [Bdellovibrionales bacterium]|nr:OpgC domain-containing protein [Bdellovibrionales bacterium]
MESAKHVSTRDDRMDTIRGLLIVLITMIHYAVRFKDLKPLLVFRHFTFGQAEAFFFIAGVSTVLAFSGVWQRSGLSGLWMPVFRAIRRLYFAHVFCVFATIFCLVLGNKLPLDWEIFDRMVGGVFLLYTPKLTRILPLYLIFMAISPFLISWAMQGRERMVILGSFAVYFVSQFVDSLFLYNFLTAFPSLNPYPFLPSHLKQETSLNLLAWQLPFMLGLVVGAHRVRIKQSLFAGAERLHTRLLPFAVFTFFAMVTINNQLLDQKSIALEFDKIRLAPLRLLTSSLQYYIVGLLAFKYPNIFRLEPFALICRNSLPLFVVHVVYLELGTAIFSTPPPTWVQVGGLVLLLGIIFPLVALGAERRRKRKRAQQRALAEAETTNSALDKAA